MSTNTRELQIQRTWNGEPASQEEHATVNITRTAHHLHIQVDAPFHGDPPPSGPPGPLWALWEHEVVEVFVVGPEELYTEVEMGPHGHHLVLRLQGRRNPVERELPLSFEATIQGTRWTGVATLPLSWLPPEPHTVNAYAIYGQGPNRRYLACYPVPGEGPDFHRLEHFHPLDL